MSTNITGIESITGMKVYDFTICESEPVHPRVFMTLDMDAMVDAYSYHDFPSTVIYQMSVEEVDTLIALLQAAREEALT